MNALEIIENLRIETVCSGPRLSTGCPAGWAILYHATLYLEGDIETLEVSRSAVHGCVSFAVQFPGCEPGGNYKKVSINK